MAGEEETSADVAIGSTVKIEDSDAPVEAVSDSSAAEHARAADVGAASCVPLVPVSIRDEGDASEAPVLSKNQQKKLAKRAKFVEQRQARKQNRKEQRKEQRKNKAAADAAAAAGEDPDGMPTAKRQRTEEEDREWVSRLGGRGQRNREWFEEERKKGQRVVVDLGFDQLMTEREVKSLVTQIAHLYGCNRKSVNPLNLYLTSVGQRCEDGLRKIAGFENWKCERETKHLSDVFAQEEIVYLTAESKEELQELNPKHVYVVGGIVDHNRLKGHCHNAAVAAGWKTAKLPLDGNVALGDHRKVLTVNHVFEILLKFQETGSWSTAMGGTVPERKLKGVAQPGAAPARECAGAGVASSDSAGDVKEEDRPDSGAEGSAGPSEDVVTGGQSM